MDVILQYVRDYGAAFAGVLAIVSIVVVFIVGSRVKKTLIKIVSLKDDTRTEKAEVMVEAFNLLNRLESSRAIDYKTFAPELDAVYNKLYAVMADIKLIQAYDKIVSGFIIGKRVAFTEFEILVRRELGLKMVGNRTKQNYLLMIEEEERKERENIAYLKQKEKEAEEYARQKKEEAEKLQIKKQEEEQKRQSLKEEKQKKKEADRLKKEQVKEEKLAAQSEKEVPVATAKEEPAEKVNLDDVEPAPAEGIKIPKKADVDENW
ncbi:MAG: hypothetical protein AB7S44_02125 [Spirochaetales bacterium]